ncbi:recombinase family protein (plasmid) [Azospirillum argentinense]|uniref:Recombinase family protein n=1 Tax=Azospirillum argentinense TaxID=2970906 RepID=A0A4D8PSG3_9PROT|nr:recombinase family protein [Azospirillum argentinense]QCO00251.1 recombinase family protein [Azospirillum argentinense]
MASYVAYYRVSTTKQGIGGLGIDAQRHSVITYIANRGELIAEFTEVESGKRKDRPELSKALAVAKARKAVLVVAKLDRLARSVAFISNLMEAGVEFIAVDCPEANRMVLHMLAVVGEYEREATSARTREALAAAKARGVRLGNPHLGNDGGALSRRGAAVRQERSARQAVELAPVVRSIWAAGVTTYAGLAEALNARGVPTILGRTWSPTTARRLALRIG